MGAWGYKAFDNDEASEIVYHVTFGAKKGSAKEIEKSLKRFNDVGWENEARGAANLIAGIANLGYGKLELRKKLKEAEQVLEALLNNNGYIETWDDRKEAKKELRKELRRVRKLLKEY